MGMIEAEFLASYLLILRLLSSFRCQKLSLNVQEWLEEAKQRSLLGSNLWVHVQESPSVQGNGANVPLKILSRLARDSYIRGESISKSLRAVQTQMRASSRYAREAQHLFISLCIKVGMISSLAFLGRAGLLIYLTNIHGDKHSPDDRIALGIGLSVTAILLLCIKGKLPKPWLWHQGFTEAGTNWLTSEFSGIGNLPGWWGKAWQELRDREQYLGIDLTSDRARIIEDWVHKLESDQDLRLMTFESALPVLEIMLAGGLAVLILLHPVSTIFTG
jgi:hypothetical protein